MPSSTSSSRPATPWPIGLLAAVALFAFSEWWIWGNETVARFIVRHQSIWADVAGVNSRLRLAPPTTERRLVLLGSSQIREGLDCGVLEAYSKGSGCLNLGISGGSALDMLRISEDLTGPRTVVIALGVGVLHRAPKSGWIDLETIRVLGRAGVLFRIGVDDGRLLGLGMLQTLSPTLRYRDSLRDILSELRPRWPESLNADRTAIVPRMTEADRESPEEKERKSREIDPITLVSPFTAAQDEALDLLISREVKAGSRVFVVDFPTSPSYRTRVSPDGRAHYERLLGRLRARSDIRFVGVSDLGPLDDAQFLDLVHADSTARQLLSEQIGRLIARDPEARPGMN